MEIDIENMALDEYREYEAEKERRFWDNARFKNSPTRYKGAEFNSSHHDKSVTLDFPHNYEDVLLDKYYALPPLLPCFQPSLPHNERGYESPSTSNKVDIDSMTIEEYNLYIAKQNKNPLNDHFYSFTPQFFSQQPNTPMGKKDSDFDKILDDLFRTGAENLRRVGIYEQEINLEKEEAQDKDGDDGDTFDMWDITVKDVERIWQFFNVPNKTDKIVQPLIPEPIHTTPPNDNYVAPATKLILDELFDEFKNKILNVTMVDKEADFNPTKGLEEFERLLAMRPQTNLMKIQIGMFYLLEGIMEMETNIENMALDEYREYEAKKQRLLWDNARFKNSPTSICEQEIDLEKEEAQEKMVMMGILLILQPLIPEPIHTTPPNDDYVAPATKLILDELLEEFKNKILNVTMVDKKADFNPTRGSEEFERLLAMRPQTNLTKIQVDRDILSPGRLCTCGGAWILNKLRESITNRTSWMLYKWLVMLHVMLDIVRGSRLGAWLRA
ncbi:hypothetical protein Tco_0088069 [Tanacetum coccineum]